MLQIPEGIMETNQMTSLIRNKLPSREFDEDWLMAITEVWVRHLNWGNQSVILWFGDNEAMRNKCYAALSRMEKQGASTVLQMMRQ